MQPGFESPYPREYHVSGTGVIRSMGKAYWYSALAAAFILPQLFGVSWLLKGNPLGVWMLAVGVVGYLISGAIMMVHVAKVYEQPAWLLVAYHIGSNILPILLPLIVVGAISIIMTVKLYKSGVKMRYWTMFPKDIKDRCDQIDREYLANSTTQPGNIPFSPNT